MKESVTIFYARRLPVSTAVSGFTYVFEAWVLSANDEKVLDGVYIRILRVTLNVSSEDHTSNINLYNKLPQHQRQRDIRLARHCVKHPEFSVILWEPTHDQSSMIETTPNAGLSSFYELLTLMEDREWWRVTIECSLVGVS